MKNEIQFTQGFIGFKGLDILVILKKSIFFILQFLKAAIQESYLKL